jgi:hypothetical protein
MAERLIIAMTGLAQSGKETVGEHLVATHGFARDAFADDMRAALYAINPPVLDTNSPNSAPFEMLARFVDRVGWKTALGHPGVHGLLQRTGTEGGWMIHGEHLWIDRVDKRTKALPTRTPVVLTDCRTLQEAAWVRECGGFIFRVDRDGRDLKNAAPLSRDLAEHTSELTTIQHDFLIVNNGSLASLRAQVDAVIDMTATRHRDRSRIRS